MSALAGWHRDCLTSSPEGDVDRAIDERIVRGRRIKRIAAAAATVGLAVAALAMLPGWLRPSVERSRLRLGKVEIGTVEATLDASGVVVPAAERSIVSPFESRVLRVLKRAGERVKTGDPKLKQRLLDYNEDDCRAMRVVMDYMKKMEVREMVG